MLAVLQLCRESGVTLVPESNCSFPSRHLSVCSISFFRHPHPHPNRAFWNTWCDPVEPKPYQRDYSSIEQSIACGPLYLGRKLWVPFQMIEPRSCPFAGSQVGVLSPGYLGIPWQTSRVRETPNLQVFQPRAILDSLYTNGPKRRLWFPRCLRAKKNFFSIFVLGLIQGFQRSVMTFIVLRNPKNGLKRLKMAYYGAQIFFSKNRK